MRACSRSWAAMLDGQSATFRVWAPNAARVSVIGDWNGWDAGAHPLERRGWHRHLGRRRPRGRARPGVQVPHRDARRRCARQGRSVRVLRGGAAGDRLGVWTLDYEWHDAEWMASRQRATRSTRRCRSTRCTSARGGATTDDRLLDLPRDRAAARRLRERAWASRTSSCCRSWSIRSTARGATRRPATSRRPPLRHAAGLHVPDRPPAPARHRRDPRLGAVALSRTMHGLALLRRHAPLRARRSAPGLPPGLEQLHLQLRPQRGARVPALERAVLARRVSHRRPARRRRRVDALPRLRAQGRRVDPEPARRPREPRGDRVPARSSTRRCTAIIPDVQTIAEESTAWPHGVAARRTSAASASA